MTHEFDRDDYSLRVLIERMQQKGSSEHDIEVAVREASRRLEHQARTRPAARRTRPLRVIRQRLLGTSSR